MTVLRSSLTLTWSLDGGGYVRLSGSDLTVDDLNEILAMVGPLLSKNGGVGEMTMPAPEDWVQVPVERAPQVAEQFATVDGARTARHDRVDYDAVARIAREARAAGSGAARVIATRLGITEEAAKSRMAIARHRGLDLGEPLPKGTNAGRPRSAPRVDVPLVVSSALVNEARASVALDGETQCVGFPPATVEDPDEDAPVVDDPPLSTHPPLCDCIRCATRRGREARDATAAAAAHAEATKIEWGHNGKLGRQKVAGDT